MLRKREASAGEGVSFADNIGYISWKSNYLMHLQEEQLWIY